MGRKHNKTRRKTKKEKKKQRKAKIGKNTSKWARVQMKQIANFKKNKAAKTKTRKKNKGGRHHAHPTGLGDGDNRKIDQYLAEEGIRDFQPQDPSVLAESEAIERGDVAAIARRDAAVEDMLRRLAALNEARPETALQRRLDALGPPPPIHEERAALDALLAQAEGLQAPPTFTPVVARGRAAAIPNIPALATRWRRRARDRASGRDANLPIARPTSGEEYEAAIQRWAGPGFIVPRYTGIQTAEPVTQSGGRKRRRRTKKTRKRRKKRRRRTRKN